MAPYCIPYIVHYFTTKHYGPWSKVVHYNGNRVQFEISPRVTRVTQGDEMTPRVTQGDDMRPRVTQGDEMRPRVTQGEDMRHRDTKREKIRNR